MAAAGAGSMRCSVHGKSRTLVNLDEVSPGEYRCKSINPCKTTATGGPGGQMAQAPPGVRTSRELAAAGHAIIHPEQAEVCHAHGKRRGPTQLYQVSTVSGPQWECLPEARCKVAGEQPDQSAQLLQQIQMGNQFNPYGSMGMSNEALLGLIGGQGGGRAFGMGGARVAGGGGIQQQLCSVHQKKRSLQSLQMNPTGMWVCKDTDQCKTKSADTGGLGMCSVHNKQRRVEYLMTNASGQVVCQETFMCQ